MVWRLAAIIWIGVSLAVQVFAVTALLDALELADTAWREPFYSLGKVYAVIINLVADNVGGSLSSMLAMTPLGDRDITIPCWWVHVLAIYAAAASAIWAGSMTRTERGERIGQVKAGGLSILWPVAIAGLIVQGIRNRVVTQFLSRHASTTLLYAVSVLGLYGFMNYVNASMLSGAPGAGQETALQNSVPCPMVMRDRVPQSAEELLDGR